MRSIFRVFMDAFDGFLEDDGWAISSHIALSTLTSLFPFLIFLTALAGLFGSKELADEAAALLLQTWPRRVADPISKEIHDVLTQPRGGLLTVGGVLALYFSSSGIEALRIGLNRAYRVREKRPWWLLRLESIGYVLIGSVALLAVAFIVVLGPLLWSALLSIDPHLAAFNAHIAFFGYGSAVSLMVFALIVAHRWLPAEKHSLRQISPGIALTLVCSLGFAAAFGAYLNTFTRNYVSTYAGLASFMISLLFLYALSSIFLFGGELNAAICRREAAERAHCRGSPEQRD